MNKSCLNMNILSAQIFSFSADQWITSIVWRQQIFRHANIVKILSESKKSIRMKKNSHLNFLKSDSFLIFHKIFWFFCQPRCWFHYSCSYYKNTVHRGCSPPRVPAPLHLCCTSKLSCPVECHGVSCSTVCIGCLESLTSKRANVIKNKLPSY